LAIKEDSTNENDIMSELNLIKEGLSEVKEKDDSESIREKDQRVNCYKKVG
jgi:hypothetical protein